MGTCREIQIKILPWGIRRKSWSFHFYMLCIRGKLGNIVNRIKLFQLATNGLHMSHCMQECGRVGVARGVLGCL